MNSATNRRVALGLGYLVYRLILIVILPVGFICAIALTTLDNLALKGSVIVLLVLAAVTVCARKIRSHCEFIEIDDCYLRIHLSDYSLQIRLDEITSVRQLDTSTQFSYDGNDLCDPFGIFMKNGDVHTPSLRPELYTIVRDLTADYLRTASRLGQPIK
jgi:hypothetical protein